MPFKAREGSPVIMNHRVIRAAFRYKRKLSHSAGEMCLKYIDTDNTCRGQQKTCCAFLIFILISVMCLHDTAKSALK